MEIGNLAPANLHRVVTLGGLPAVDAQRVAPAREKALALLVKADAAHARSLNRAGGDELKALKIPELDRPDVGRGG